MSDRERPRRAAQTGPVTEEVQTCRPTLRSSSSTSQGITSVKEGPARLDAGKDQLKVFGSELKAFYLTMGRYDVVAVSAAPDDAAAAKVALAIGSAGNVSTETLRAFTEGSTARSSRRCRNRRPRRRPRLPGDRLGRHDATGSAVLGRLRRLH
jgi:uncharacterized protein with GYD domain